jgi:Methyltransferase domain
VASPIEADPNENDPGRWGHSLTNVAEILFPCLDAAGARSVAEVGAYAGDLTGELIRWADRAGARVIAIDPTPEPQLVELAEQRSDLELIRETSHEALRHLSLPDAVIIDGDHNYYTVREELRLINEKAPGSDIPLLMFHDVGWPHARRDTYFAPERIPEEHRQPLAGPAGLFPGKPGLVDGALPFDFAAQREGGPRNGVLTAIEDFMNERDGLRLATVPVFFGFGILWHTDAPWADAVAEVVGVWDRNPLLARLESNRLFHLATVHTLYTKTAELEMVRERLARSEELLRALLDSGGLAVADRLAGLRHPGRPHSWREQVRSVLGDDRTELSDPVG